MKNVFTCMLIFFAIGVGTPAFPHGDAKPQYGGVVQSVGDVSYELAPHERGSVLYVEDHGNPLPTSDYTGILAVMTGTRRVDTALKPIGENRMLASGVLLVPGMKATAVLRTPSGLSIVIQFPPK